MVFGDKQAAVAFFGRTEDLSSKNVKVSRNAATETSMLQAPIDAFVQVPEKHNGQTTQTDCKDTLDNVLHFKQFSSESFCIAAYASDLISFLQATSRTMLSELESASESRAFEDHNLRFGAPEIQEVSEHVYSLTWESEESGTRNVRTDDTRLFFYSAPTDHRDTLNSEQKQLEVTKVDWNCTGSIVAASYGSTSSICWSESKGAVVFWDIKTRNFNPSVPMLVRRYDSRLFCIAAHPTRPSIFASGSENCEVLLFDVNENQPLIACSKISSYFHSDALSYVCWVRNSPSPGWNLCSVGKDGKVYLWSFESKLKYPLHGLRLDGRTENATFVKRMSSDVDEEMVPLVFGWTALSFSKPKDMSDQNFVVGSECGAIVSATLYCEDASSNKKKSGSKLKWSSNALQVISQVPQTKRDKVIRKVEERAILRKRRGIDCASVYDARPPVELIYPTQKAASTYEHHNGAITSISFNSFQEKLFLTSSLDGVLRLYNSRLKTPILSIDPSLLLAKMTRVSILDAQFSPSKPTMFAAASKCGRIFVYDVSKPTECPTAILKPSDVSMDGSAATSLSFNKLVRSLLAVGYANGRIDVWRLPQSLTRQSSQDQDVLNELAGNLITHA